ncbi:hypothetical protein LZP73_11015 [Shewanella sp. AS16]|uniref:hypothetical protein n=1 Tax=Shewanella sp. AS16 TaxID=2907625 RepID=UPI001F302A56|nr:hypothetical protein [Shewanella sp. AS16]MCE9686737.1 hypothetical protein [Shewanella sp. AS16]
MMKKILIVTTPDGFFAQNKMPWSSMDTLKIKDKLSSYGFLVEIVDFDYIKYNLNSISNFIIIYTSSQRPQHKQYIEDIVYYLDADNFLIPSFESLKAHDNKGFQYLLNEKYNLGLIKSDYICDVSELKENTLDFPFVIKPANGASSMGVKIVGKFKDIKKCLFNKDDLSFKDVKRVIKKYLLTSRYNQEWEDYLGFGSQRFVVQSLLPGLKYDYKVLIFGDKFYLLKRYTRDGDFRASGSGIHSTIFDAEVYKVLDAANEFKEKYPSHIYSLDMCVFENNVSLIEFQFTHVGPVTLSDSNFYFQNVGGKWERIESTSCLEYEFANSIVHLLSSSFYTD